MRLRVAVPPYLARAAPGSGHGNVWRHVLAELGTRVRLMPREPGRRLGRRPDVWLSNGHDGPLATDEPVVAHVYETPWADPGQRDLVPAAFLDPIRARTEAGVRAATLVIAPSESTRRDVIAACGVPAARVRAVPYGVDSERFRPGLAGGRDSVGAPYVLFASRPFPRKNLPALRAAIGGLARRGLPHVLVIAGGALDGDDGERDEAAACEPLPGLPGRVRRLRDVSDGHLAALMAEAAAFCLPSLGEGFGLTALEAMAAGAPVVVSDRGALPEVVGDAGLVVPPTAGAIEQALHRVLTDGALARELSTRGRRRALELTWARAVEGWLAALESAAAAR